MRLASPITLPLLGLLSLFVPRDARAAGPVDLELGAKGGGGSNLSLGAGDLLGFALGGRGGVSAFGFYGGVDIVRYFGSTVVPSPGDKVWASAWMAGVDLGYNIKIAMVIVRPQLGTGDFFVTGAFSRSPCRGCLIEIQTYGSSSSHNLYFEPGVTALVPFGTFFAGADANWFILPHIVDESGDKPQTAFTLHCQIGVHF
jgi:hypothetical protein